MQNPLVDDLVNHFRKQEHRHYQGGKGNGNAEPAVDGLGGGEERHVRYRLSHAVKYDF